MKKNKALFTSNSQVWQTPPWILDLVRSIGPIELDPCTAADNPVQAANFFTEKDNGLKQPWNTQRALGYESNGLVYVNPPYKYASEWTKKCVGEWTRGNTIISLIPARTDTKYYHDWIFQTAGAVCFMKGRVKFLEPTAHGPVERHPAPMPTALVVWTHSQQELDAFVEVTKPHGRTFVFHQPE